MQVNLGEICFSLLLLLIATVVFATVMGYLTDPWLQVGVSANSGPNHGALKASSPPQTHEGLSKATALLVEPPSGSFCWGSYYSERMHSFISHVQLMLLCCTQDMIANVNSERNQQAEKILMLSNYMLLGCDRLYCQPPTASTGVVLGPFFKSPIQYGTFIIRTSKRGPNVENYPQVCTALFRRGDGPGPGL